MSEGPSSPNIDNSFVHRQQLQALSGGNGTVPLFLGVHAEANVGRGLGLQQAAPVSADKMILPPAQRPNGPIAGLLKQMGITREELARGLKEVAQAGAVREASQAELFGQGGPAGGSFVSAVSGPSVDSDGHGIG
jgi:hypothetical protein